jgi:UDP-N-acetylmuramate--alanine ligase
MKQINEYQHIFFIGIAGTGMSAIAQYLAGKGKSVSGSDRYFVSGQYNDTRTKLEAEGILCYEQDGTGISSETELVVVSTAIESTVQEVQKAITLGITILKRSEVLALISASVKTIAIGGTSGKSTTSAMLFDILNRTGMSPGIISGAGLVSLIRNKKIGNAAVGNGEWLIIEADESDGSIVQYHPEIGVLLNIDKDHQETKELMQIFSTFCNHTKSIFIVNRGNTWSAQLSQNISHDFSAHSDFPAGYQATHFMQTGMKVQFSINGYPFEMKTVGRHNMENALAAVAVAHQLGVSFEIAADAILNYEGIYRRHQVLGEYNGITLIDDYAHNPVKCAASIQACQPIAPKVIAWFQPHGYGPTRFLKDDFILEIANALRLDDEIWMSEIFYAGGTATKDISANELIEGIKAKGKKAFFVADRNYFFESVKERLTDPSVLLLMGARDPSLEAFGLSVRDSLKIEKSLSQRELE